MASTYILGISCYYHDSGAALLKDGVIVAAAQEERFTRIKQDEEFPRNAINYCLREAGIETKDLTHVVFYDKPLLKFERILETTINVWPFGYFPMLQAFTSWLGKKLWTRQNIAKELPGYAGEILFTEHHVSHAASAYYSSPFSDATVVTVDGVGEWETTTIGFGKDNKLTLTHAVEFPHSLGLLYSAMTGYLGFRVNSAEYKVMGLAPYGNPKEYMDAMWKLIDVREDGSYRLNMKYFGYTKSLRMTNRHFHALFGGPPRAPESKLEQRHKDIAAALQVVTEEVMLKIVRHAHSLHPSENLCLAGGVALNCVANARILREGPFKNIFIQPASGDAGGALGAAQDVWHNILGNPKTPDTMMRHCFLGPSFSDEEIERYLKEEAPKEMGGEIHWKRFNDRNEFLDTVARIIDGENVIGLLQGRMEFGPRALGNRSIIADARRASNWQKVNLKIKFRESFRPFAPSVLADRASEWFDLRCESPYMLLTAPVKQKDIPAVTHVDNSARLQTVTREQNPLYYDLIDRFAQRTGCPVIINTSFNVRGEPIVCSPRDALRCFLNTEMDYLVLGSCVLDKKEHHHLLKGEARERYLKQFALD
jgi:carbamoyltransferase